MCRRSPGAHSRSRHRRRVRLGWVALASVPWSPPGPCWPSPARRRQSARPGLGSLSSFPVTVCPCSSSSPTPTAQAPGQAVVERVPRGLQHSWPTRWPRVARRPRLGVLWSTSLDRQPALLLLELSISFVPTLRFTCEGGILEVRSVRRSRTWSFDILFPDCPYPYCAFRFSPPQPGILRDPSPSLVTTHQEARRPGTHCPNHLDSPPQPAPLCSHPPPSAPALRTVVSHHREKFFAHGDSIAPCR